MVARKEKGRGKLLIPWIHGSMGLGKVGIGLKSRKNRKSRTSAKSRKPRKSRKSKTIYLWCLLAWLQS